MKQLTEDLDVSELNVPQEINSEVSIEVIGKIKLELSIEIELDEKVFLGSETYITREPSKSLELRKKELSILNTLLNFTRNV